MFDVKKHNFCSRCEVTYVQELQYSHWYNHKKSLLQIQIVPAEISLKLKELFFKTDTIRVHCAVERMMEMYLFKWGVFREL